ncbi:YhcH/YjgK/YiaL family protein [Vibrio scophthalmi]|uniref:YhcH/YjgK/YiaL family protein n=1 Tax=Vibrio scophthalmi TaxID=45658 RepID=UPI002FEF1519
MFTASTAELSFARFLQPKLIELIERVMEQTAQPIENGRHDLEGDSAFFLVMDDNTQPLEQRKSECHQRYLDVQLLLEGEETFGYSLLPYTGLDEDYLADKDLAFSEQLQQEQFVTIKAGEFVVFYPGQPHRPLVAVNNQPAPVRKVVIKIEKSLFE